MNTYLAHRGESSVVIRNVTDAWAEGLRDLFAPYVSLTRLPADFDAGLWSVEVCPHGPGTGDLFTETEGYDVAIADRPRCVRVLTADDDAGTVQSILRVVRALLRRLFMSDESAFCLHAAAVVADCSEGCIAVVGAKRSGKTSAMLTALRTGLFDYLTNDDLIIVDGADDEYVGHGWPRSVNIRKESADELIPPAELSRLSHPENTMNERLGRGGLAYPGELADIFSRRVVAHARIAVFVFPGWGTGNTITRLTPAETAARLKVELPVSPSHADGWMDDLFPELLTRSATVDLDRISAAVPGYSVTSRDFAGLEENIVDIGKTAGLV
jgi:hypothetical protein